MGCCFKSHLSKILWLFLVRWKELLSQMVGHKGIWYTAGFCAMYCLSNHGAMLSNLAEEFPRHFPSDWLVCFLWITDFFFFFSQALYIYKIQRSPSSWCQSPEKWTAQVILEVGIVFASFQSSLTALRELWCYKQLNLSYWNTSNFQQSWRHGKCFLPWICCMPGLFFSSCRSQRIHLLFAIRSFWIEFSVCHQLF